jgi:PTH1 family peptidyl-tRNA hydrolase
MKLIVGLGNPDKKYVHTRHNVGFIVLDSYLGDVSWKKKFNAFYYVQGDICFIKPLTYMNNSGEAVQAFANYYKVDINDILVIQDDLDMQFGTYKVKNNSSDGGHNGIKSIIKMLNSDAFARLKIGIGDNEEVDTIDYVLGSFNKEEIDYLTNNKDFNRVIDLFIHEGIEKTLNTYRG